MSNGLEEYDEIQEEGPSVEPNPDQKVGDRNIKYDSFREAYTVEDTFWEASLEWLRNTANGRNKVGWYIGRGLDIAEIVAPIPVVGKIRKIAKQSLNLNKTRNEVRDMDWIINRLDEQSTWRGIIAAATGVGMSISPEQADAIAKFGVALFGLVEVYTKEPQSPDSNN